VRAAPDNFLPQLMGRKIKLAAECMLYMKLQTGHLNTRHMAYMKPHCRVKVYVLVHPVAVLGLPFARAAD
jgi:hypothetical protein